ncbi:MAG: hypothetical protein ABL912_03315 [Novosphingobium sp.]
MNASDPTIERSTWLTAAYFPTMPAHNGDAAMATGHHHVRHFHRFRKHQAAMLVDRAAARFAARHQFLKIASLVIEQFDSQLSQLR